MSVFTSLILNSQNIPFVSDDSQYLYFVPQDTGGVMKLEYASGSVDKSTVTPTLEYSYDANAWYAFDVDNGCRMELGQPVYFKAGNTTTKWSSGSSYTWTFAPNVRTKAYGNILSVFGAGAVTAGWQLVSMFSNKNIIKIPDLNTTTLNQSGYYNTLAAYSGIEELPSINVQTATTNQCFAHAFRETNIVYTDKEFKISNNQVQQYNYTFRDCKFLKNLVKMQSSFSAAANILDDTYDGCISLVDTDSQTFSFASGMGSAAMNCTFYGCSSMVKAPTIKVTGKVGDNALKETFRNCTSLKDASRIDLYHVTSTGSRSFYYMFYMDTNLEVGPSNISSAISLGSASCYYMFYNCSKLKKAPDLNFTSVSTNSCYRMFGYCTNLTEAPALRPKTLVSGCYNYMFYGCSKLNRIAYHGSVAPSSTYCSNWVYNVSQSGTFYRDIDSAWEIKYGVSAIPTGWEVKTLGALKISLATGNQGSIELAVAGNSNLGNNNINIEYSTDRKQWASLTSQSVKVSDGKLYIRGKNPNGINSIVTNNNQKYIYFSTPNSKTKLKLEGNLMSLIDYDNPPEEFPQDSSMYGLFEKTMFSDISNLEMPSSLTDKDKQNIFLNSQYIKF